MTIRQFDLCLNVSRSTGKHLCFALATATALTGCSLGPVYKRPEVPVPQEFSEKIEAPVAWPSTDWWRGFKSSELDGYIAQAKLTNNDFAAAVARVREADAQAQVAGAALLPAIGLSVTDLKERVQATTGGGYVDFRQYSPQLTASYMIDFWGKNKAAQRAAIASAMASRHDQAVVELTVITSVATSYFLSIELRERIAVAESNLAGAEVILRGLRRQRDVGIATSLDVAQQETTVSALSATIPPLRQQLRQTIHALAILTGQPPESLETTKATLADITLPVVGPGLPSELLARRPDVAEAESQLISANANIQVARAAFFPSITLTAGDGFASSALSTLLKSSSGVYTVAAGLAQPLFEGGLLKGQYAFAKARYDELAANYRKAVLTAFGNVEDALVAVEQTNEQVKRQGTAAATASRAHDIAQAQMRAGTVNILTVLNTETALFTAQDALVQARYSNLQALVSLYSALGGGWQKESGT